ncbi:MAG: type II toxin-antitoxin system RelE/ParE family toxin [Nitrospirae bacterium]|nr:MAG: type II toxin-antitoxin system RelE/ParE family toxin [Nitrospirota bacterium]
MAGKQPVFTENFSANLTAIETFLGPEGAAVFQRLLARLFDDIIPTFCRFPKSGRAFLSHPVRSAEARTLAKRLRTRLQDAEALREFIVEDYLVLYLIRREGVAFLSIKHHRQLSFDFRKFWQES